MSFYRWIKKIWYIYTLVIKKNEIMLFAATCMDLEIILRELSWERERQLYDIVYMWNLKKTLMNYKTETNPQTNKTNFMVTIGEIVGEGYIRIIGLTYTHSY